MTPGPDMAVVTRNALARGRRGALATSIGIEVGLVVWAVASVVGLAALLRASTTAFTLVRLAGAAYLVYLGVRIFLALRRRRSEPAHGALRFAAGSPFQQGLLSNLLNPKIAVFFTSLIPQFVVPGPAAERETAFLAGIFIVVGLVWLGVYSFVATAASDLLRRPRIRKALDVVTGSVLVGFGIRLAADSA